ncbi:hypothetical protein R1flu_023418 [Riccia fluitans]|uniref:Uncharacterized protein n=1 Tax=Riccia fluitans TaxID=41844 RepID=A0ABD1XV06_9MARC
MAAPYCSGILLNITCHNAALATLSLLSQLPEAYCPRVPVLQEVVFRQLVDAMLIRFVPAVLQVGSFLRSISLF